MAAILEGRHLLPFMSGNKEQEISEEYKLKEVKLLKIQTAARKREKEVGFGEEALWASYAAESTIPRAGFWQMEMGRRPELDLGVLMMKESSASFNQRS